MSTIVNVPAEPIASVGQTIIYEDPGSYGCIPAKDRRAVVLEIRPSRHHRFYYLVAAEGVNHPKLITERQIIGYTPRYDSVMAEAAPEGVEESEAA